MTYDEVMDAVRDLFNNPDVPVSQTRDDLQGLRDEIEIMLESLPEWDEE